MTLKDYIANHRPTLETTLLSYLETKKQTYRDIPLYQKSIEKLMDTVTTGKLVRGILLLLAYESKCKTVSKDALTLAAAIELIHTGLLIHDDIMDNDHLRRGKPTVYAQAMHEGKIYNADNEKDYGVAIAICIGDLAFFMAYELIGMLSPSAQNKQILATSAHELQKVGYAQITDVHFGRTQSEPTEDEIISLYRFKTARYSFSLPLKLGGMLAGCDEITIKNLEQFGEELGIAFQIKDDELGIFGIEETVGKPVGSDIRENKKTLYRHILFQLADGRTKDQLNKIYGNTVITNKDISKIKQYMMKYNVLKTIQKVREDKSESALTILDSIIMPDKYKMIFTDLVKFTNNREK